MSSKHKGVMFTGPSVLAIGRGDKMQTRRLVKNPPRSGVDVQDADWVEPYGNAQGLTGSWSFMRQTRECPAGQERRNSNSIAIDVLRPPYQVGDVIYVKEAYLPSITDGNAIKVAAYQADNYELKDGERWKPALFMPRWAARTWLQITDVRCQRVADISIDDITAEGIDDGCGNRCAMIAVENWKSRWNFLHDKPKPVKVGGKIDHYVSYPWDGKYSDPLLHRGKPWVIRPNPFVFAYTFQITERPE